MQGRLKSGQVLLGSCDVTNAVNKPGVTVLFTLALHPNKEGGGVAFAFEIPPTITTNEELADHVLSGMAQIVTQHNLAGK